MDKRNENSFIQKEVIQLQANNRGPYVVNNRYRCPYHPRKPRGGMLVNLLQHVQQLAKDGSDAREKAQHKALWEVLVQVDLV